MPTAATSLVEKAQGGLRGYLESRVKLDLTDLSVDGLWALAERGEQMEMAGALLAGLANRELSTRVDKNTLTDEMKRRGKTRSKFYYAIGLVQAFESLPEAAAAESLAALGPTKVRATLGWSGDERAAFASGQPVRGITIEDAAELSTRDFEQRIKAEDPELARAKAEAASLKTDLASAKLQLQRQARAAAALETEGEFPAFARAPRHEVFAFEQAAAFMLDNLSLLLAEHLFGDVRHPEANRFLPVVAANCQAALAAVELRIRGLRQQIETAFPGCADAPLTLDHQLSAAEGALLIDRAARMRHQLERERKRREDERANTQVGRRGNKRGARNPADS